MQICLVMSFLTIPNRSRPPLPYRTANGILSNFLSLAGHKTVDMQTVSLNSVVNSIAPIIQSDALMTDKSVLLMLNEIPPLLMDNNEIRQLILNLARNGLEAMQPGGLLIIRTRSDNGEVFLEVEDQGQGIPHEMLDKLGNPFQTTKENGSGLGLAVCYSIANRHNAHIEVNTNSKGTIFSVRFPVGDTNSKL